MKAPVEASRSNITAKLSRYQHRRSCRRQIDTRPAKNSHRLAVGRAGPCDFVGSQERPLIGALAALNTDGDRGELKNLAGLPKALADREPSS
jgi:hypothetical protein